MKRLKNFLFIMFCAFTPLFVSAQSYDTRLEPYFTKEEIKLMQERNPKQYQFLVNALNKAIFIADIPKEKTPVTYNGVLNIDPNADHTFLSLGLEITDFYQYFQINGTDKMLVVLPKIFLEPK
jgi:hypothetical protein